MGRGAVGCGYYIFKFLYFISLYLQLYIYIFTYIYMFSLFIYKNKPPFRKGGGVCLGPKTADELYLARLLVWPAVMHDYIQQSLAEHKT
jgi:hypothetical protein